MRRPFVPTVAWALVLHAAFTPGVRAGAPSPSVPSAVTPELSARVWAVTEAVLTHHVDPPTRPEMVLSGLKAVYKGAGKPLPRRLARDVSSVTTPELLGALLKKAWPVSEGPAPEHPLDEALVDGLLACVPGGGDVVSAKQQRVNESMAANLYVGIHVALRKDKGMERPEFAEVFEGGPSDRAGVKKGDQLEGVDGRPVAGEPLVSVIERLRGPEGTDVVIDVRTPPAGGVRTLKIRRGRLPHVTVQGVRKRPEGGWEVCLDDAGAGPVGYIKVESILGSTPQEVRALAGRIEERGARALILDLRGVSQSEFHPTVLLADALLDGGVIGRVRWDDRVETFRAEPDGLFLGRPLAVLVDETTWGATAWLAAALQDNHRAAIVGRPTLPYAGVIASIPILGGTFLVNMTTGTLERADGRALGSPVPPPYRFAEGGFPMTVRMVEADGKSSSGVVTPDVLVAGAPRTRGNEAPARPPTAPSAAGTADPVVAKALEWLRGALSKS